MRKIGRKEIITSIVLLIMSVSLFFFTLNAWPAMFPGLVVLFMFLLFRDSKKRLRRKEMTEAQFKDVSFITVVLGALNAVSAVIQVIYKLI